MSSTALDRTLAESGETVLTTRSGLPLRLRPVGVSDGPGVAALFDRLGPEGLRVRFLSGLKHLSSHQVAELIEVDHRHVEHLLAFADGKDRPVASLLIAADEEMEAAEVAIAVMQDWRNKGIGYALLRHAVDLAQERGIGVMRAVESRTAHDAIEVERTMGFTAKACEGDATLVILERRLD